MSEQRPEQPQRRRSSRSSSSAPTGSPSAPSRPPRSSVAEGDGRGDDDGSGETSVTEMVQQPAKVMRIGTMVKQLLEEVKAAPLDEASRARLKEIHASSIKELEEGLAPELVEELHRLSLPFAEDAVPSEGELRIAQAQLVGWLEGLFHGIQAAMYAQQLNARAQVEQSCAGPCRPASAACRARATGGPPAGAAAARVATRAAAAPAGCTSSRDRRGGRAGPRRAARAGRR